MLKEGQPVFERVSCEPHRPITGCRNRTGHRTRYMTTATTMAADVLAHLPPRKRLKVAAQIPTTTTDEPPAHVSLLALGAQRLKHAQEKNMVTETHGRPAGPKMNPMSPTTLMRVAGSFEDEPHVPDDEIAPRRGPDSPGTVAANAKAEAVAKRRTANEKARVAKDAARVADELATLAREAKRKAEELLGGSRRKELEKATGKPPVGAPRSIRVKPKLHSPKPVKPLTDEEVAMQLHMEMNASPRFGRERRGRGGGGLEAVRKDVSPVRIPAPPA